MHNPFESDSFMEGDDDVSKIEFSTEDVVFHMDDVENYKTWIQQIIEREEQELVQLTYIFCSDFYHVT